MAEMCAGNLNIELKIHNKEHFIPSEMKLDTS